jgi:3'-5' exoribonuclease
LLVKDLTDGEEIDQVLLVRSVERRARRGGGRYLRVRLGDRSGVVQANIWRDVEGSSQIKEGEPIHVLGLYAVHPNYGAEIKLRALHKPKPSSYSMADLLDASVRELDRMESELRKLLETICNPHLRELLDSFLGMWSEAWPRYSLAPAAKHYHQAYQHGLLEHSLSVAQAVSAASATFPGIDRDLAVTGALLHDIGKLDAYTEDPRNIDLTDAGRLLGEIPLGYHRIRRMIESIVGFPPDLAQAIEHIVLSHHGALEHGSPVVPCTREATLVHMIDNLGGRLGSFDRLQRELGSAQRWSGFDRPIGASACFGLA